MGFPFQLSHFGLVAKSYALAGPGGLMGRFRFGLGNINKRVS